MEREKQLSILYQKQGRATQFASKADRDKWLQKEIDDLERVLASNLKQVSICLCNAYISFLNNMNLLRTSNLSHMTIKNRRHITILDNRQV